MDLFSADARTSRAELSGTRVLLVEDEDDARDMLEELLTRAGCVVSTACSAAEALERLDDVQPEVIVSDIGMPGEDGYSLMRRIRARGHGRGAEVPSIAVTAYTSTVDRRRAIQAGFDLHVAKPVRAGALLDALRNLVTGSGVASC
jgi:CheY-like chemotaxis protein